MTAPTISAPKVELMPAIPGFQLVNWTQHWTLIDGSWYRDAIARRTSDGQLRIISVLEES